MTELYTKKISPVAVSLNDEKAKTSIQKSPSTLEVKIAMKQKRRHHEAKLLKESNLNEIIIPTSSQMLKKHTILNFSYNSSSNSSIKSNATTTASDLKYLIEYPFRAIKYKNDKYNFWSTIKTIFVVLFNILLIIPVSMYMGIVLPLSWLFRLTFQLFHVCHLTSASKYQDSIPEFLSPIELFWLFNSNLLSSPSFRTKQNAIGSCLMFMEGPISKANLKNLIKSKIINSEQRSNQKNFVRFTQRLYRLLAFGYVWLDCDEAVFDLDEHISVIDEDSDLIKTDEDLQVYVSNLITNHEFNTEKPLWKIYLKPNFVLNESENEHQQQQASAAVEKGTVVIFLFHMCFADGISLMRILFKTLIDNRNVVEIKPRFAGNKVTIEFVQQFFCSLYRLFANLACQRCDKNPIHHSHYKKRCFKDLRSFPLDSENSRGYRGLQQKMVMNQTSSRTSVRRVLWSKPFSSVAFNRLKLITRTKINDFLLSLVSNILREYLQHKGVNNPQDMHCLIPVDLSGNKHPVKLQNFTTLSAVKAPCNTEGIVPSLWQTRSIMNKVKKSGEFFFVYFFMCFVFKALPNRLAAYLVRRLVDKSTFLATSMGTSDASLSTVFLCGQNVRQMIVIHPTICHVGISFSVMNYGEDVRLAIMIDPDIYKSPEFIVTEFNNKLDILNKLLSGRRIPGEVRRPMRYAIIQPVSIKRAELTANKEEETDLLHVKLNRIYGEIQVLSDYCDKLDPTATDFNNLKHLAFIKRERFKKEFREILGVLQEKQYSSQAISSDEEEDMSVGERARLRSISAASRSSSLISIASRKPSSRNSSAIHEPVSAVSGRISQNEFPRITRELNTT